MIAHQNSSRGGTVIMKLCGKGVAISGKAVLALQGVINIE